jgi:small subunit ribosomal protein S19e
MVTVYDVSAQKLIEATASDLQGKLTQPDWTKFVKTGPQAERLPSQPDWYFKRAASLLRRVYVNGPVGIERFRTVYGGQKNRGAKPSRFARSGGKIIRIILQSLENMELVSKTPKGRTISAKGQKYLDSISKRVSEEQK